MATPVPPMPSWLRRKSLADQREYFRKHPFSKYNPFRPTQEGTKLQRGYDRVHDVMNNALKGTPFAVAKGVGVFGLVIDKLEHAYGKISNHTLTRFIRTIAPIFLASVETANVGSRREVLRDICRMYQSLAKLERSNGRANT
jgi:hypothetical protein